MYMYFQVFVLIKKNTLNTLDRNLKVTLTGAGVALNLHQHIDEATPPKYS